MSNQRSFENFPTKIGDALSSTSRTIEPCRHSQTKLWMPMVARRFHPSMSLALSFASHANLDIRHVLLPNDHPIRPCWVLMKASWPSQPDLELNRPPPGVAIRLLVVSFLALLEPWVVLPTVLGSGRSHHDSDHHSLFLNQLGRPPTALLPSSTLWVHVVYSGCFALLHTTQIPAGTVVA